MRAAAHPLLLMAITTSSNEAFPARSPMPLMVHSICRAPAMAPARLLAVESPRSFWQCVEKTTFSAPGVFARRSAIKPPNSCGRFQPAQHQLQHQAGGQIILTVHGGDDSPLCLMYLRAGLPSNPQAQAAHSSLHRIGLIFRWRSCHALYSKAAADLSVTKRVLPLL